MANFFLAFSLIFYYRKLYHTLGVTILIPPIFVMITLTFPNHSYHGIRCDQVNDLIFTYLTVGIIYNMSLFVYNANILLYILGGHSDIYNNWVFSLIVHLKIETFQFCNIKDKILDRFLLLSSDFIHFRECPCKAIQILVVCIPDSSPKTS